MSKSSLTDLFRQHGHESPGSFLKRIRVSRACELLASGARPIDAAQAAGFESSSAFHQQFLARTGVTPAAFGALNSAFKIRLPAHYRIREVLNFYGRDSESVSELVRSSGFSKCLLIGNKPACIDIEFIGNRACCATDCDPYEAHRVVLRMLGLDSDAAGFERQFADDPLLGDLIQRQKGLRIPLTPDPWEALAWAVMGQQINLTMAVMLRRNLIEATGQQHPSGLRAHPSAEVVASMSVDDLRAMKFSASKAEYLLAAARAVHAGSVPIEALRDFSVTHAARLLGAIRGVGPWTIQYAFLRGLGFGDCLPSGDAGLAQALARLRGTRPTEPEIRSIMAAYAPWRSLATYHVWASLKGETE